jgi:hypothetical protein
MDIVLFSSITTEKALRQLELEGEKYEGLYVDMNDKEQRKYVKDAAQFISDTLKKLDRARIDMAKVHKISIEAEAKAVRERLESANLPFTMLIDAHKHERAEILAAEKAKADAIGLAIQISGDHNEAILIDKVETYEKAEREQARIDNEQRIASDAARKAVQQEKKRQEYEAQALEASRLQREADEAHVSDVRRKAKGCLMAYGMSEDMAKTIVIAIHKGGIANVTINY